jgi:hypothetical protein
VLTLVCVQDIGVAVGTPPEVRSTDSHVLLTFRGTSDRRSGDRDTRIRMSMPKRLVLELGQQLIARAGGYEVASAPSWYSEILDVLQSRAGEGVKTEDAVAVVRRLSQAWRDSHAEPAV